MSGHTKGPWTIGTFSPVGWEICTVYGVERQPTEDGRGQEWVYVLPPRVINDRWQHWPNEAEKLANARLIAAAPDLLAALKRIERDWDGEPEDMDEAREAISKAEGRP